jgi:hypothetical protein
LVPPDLHVFTPTKTCEFAPTHLAEISFTCKYM